MKKNILPKEFRAKVTTTINQQNNQESDLSVEEYQKAQKNLVDMDYLKSFRNPTIVDIKIKDVKTKEDEGGQTFESIMNKKIIELVDKRFNELVKLQNEKTLIENSKNIKQTKENG